MGRLTLGATALLLMLSFQTAQGAITCETSDYRGTYAFYSVGALLVLPPAGAPLLGTFAQSGTFTSDGQGNITIESDASYNGLILPGPAVATYTITPECVLTISLTLPFPLSVESKFTAILSNNNREATVFISDPPGTLVIGRHKKQDLRFCGVGDFRGAYKIDIDGYVSAPASRAGRFGRFGRLVADGDGRFTAWSFADYNGRLVEEQFSGTYDVTGRCKLTMNYNSNNEDIVISGHLSGHGEGAAIMLLSPSWAVSGTLSRQ